jgi:hypothetical protein
MVVFINTVASAQTVSGTVTEKSSGAVVPLDVPSYAGLWIDSAGNLHALIVDLRDSARLRSRVEPMIATITQSGEMARANHSRHVIIEKATFDMRQLLAWKRQFFFAVKEMPSFSGIGISQRHNVVAVSFDDQGDVERIRTQLARLGVPKNAVRVELKGKAKALSGTLGAESGNQAPERVTECFSMVVRHVQVSYDWCREPVLNTI